MAHCWAHLSLALVVLHCMPVPWVHGAGSDVGSVKEGQAWCVAKSDAEGAAVQAALDWACGLGGSDCGPIQQGGRCFQPDDVRSHASYAFNDYFLRHGPAASACDFAGTATFTSTNPSAGNCVYPSRNGNMTGAGAPGPALPEGTSGGPRLQLKTWPMSLKVVLQALTLTAQLDSILQLVIQICIM